MYSVPILGTVLYLYAQMGQVVSLSPLCGRGGNMLSSPILFAFAALGTAPADPLRYPPGWLVEVVAEPCTPRRALELVSRRSAPGRAARRVER